MSAGEEHPRSSSTTVAQQSGREDELPLVSDLPGKLEKEAEGLLLVAAGRFALQPAEIELRAVSPEHERQHAGNGRIAMGERQRLRKALLERQRGDETSRC
jgi:hypothetical protein